MIPDRNLALELVRVTETAALAAAPWVGRGEKDLADGAAVKAMRAMINTVDMSGIVVIGEGEVTDEVGVSCEALNWFSEIGVVFGVVVELPDEDGSVSRGGD